MFPHSFQVVLFCVLSLQL